MSRQEVIEASRNFICIRPQTYESAEEGKTLESYFRGRSGQLENTVFCIFSPDGKTKLCRSGRSPKMVFRDAAEMTSFMKSSMKKYKVKAEIKSLPYHADVRLGLNVASCDLRPLVILSSSSKGTLAKMEKRMVSLAWGDRFIGRFMYASSRDESDLDEIDGVRGKSGYLIIQPGKFGQDGKALIHVPEKATEKELHEALEKALGMHEADEKDTRRHIQEGRKTGVHWETEIPVTDSGGKRRKGK